MSSASPLNDDGFRGPGKRQFLAALDRYQSGVPRSFAERACFCCGKIRGDVDHDLQRCSRCVVAFYCSKVSSLPLTMTPIYGTAEDAGNSVEVF
jgi:uncharacterized paraquat-inducible protein A